MPSFAPSFHIPDPAKINFNVSLSSSVPLTPQTSLTVTVLWQSSGISRKSWACLTVSRIPFIAPIITLASPPKKLIKSSIVFEIVFILFVKSENPMIIIRAATSALSESCGLSGSLGSSIAAIIVAMIWLGVIFTNPNWASFCTIKSVAIAPAAIESGSLFPCSISYFEDTKPSGGFETPITLVDHSINAAKVSGPSAAASAYDFLRVSVPRESFIRFPSWSLGLTSKPVGVTFKIKKPVPFKSSTNLSISSAIAIRSISCGFNVANSKIFPNSKVVFTNVRLVPTNTEAFSATDATAVIFSFTPRVTEAHSYSAILFLCLFF